MVRLLIGMLLAATPARALHKESPPAYRISSGASHFHPPTKSWGNSFAFSSNEDLARTGNTRREIFIFNLAHFDCYNGTTFPTTPCPSPLPPFLVQATNGPGEPDNPSIALPFDSDDPPDAVEDTQWLAFDALGNFNGGTGPAAGHRQVFLKNLFTNEIRQVTFGIDGDSVRPSLSSLGGVVVFESTARLTTNPTPAGVSQIYLYETNTRVLRQLSNGVGPSTRAMTNQGGTLISFQSTANLLADGADTAISQIFWAQYERRFHTFTLSQLTNGDGPSEHPYITEINSSIVFDSAATNLPGTLGGGGTNIFMSTPLTAGSPQPPALSQLTNFTHFGNCDWPAADPGSVADHIAFVCDGDPLENLTVGRRLFVLELSTFTLYQITGAGDVAPPVGTNLGGWFVTLSTTSDLTNQGTCGYQLYFVDYNPGFWDAATQRGQLPPDGLRPNASSIIGVRTFEVLEGDTTAGSQVAVTTSDGATTAGIPDGGSMRMVIGAPDEFTGIASLSVSRPDSTLPPIPVPGFGTLCLELTDDGHGRIDCDGGDPGGDVTVSQDHMIDDSNPLCLEPDCREDASCQGTLPGPHRTLCPVCIGYDPEHQGDGACVGGPYDGQPCTTDEACQASMGCQNGTVATCNGVVTAAPTGTFIPGGMVMSLPVKLSFSRSPGIDQVPCDGDDTYSTVRDIPASLWLTTGTASATVLDRDATPGATLAVTETGAPFDCIRLRAGDLEGARMVGVVPLLDIPNIPMLHDLLLSVRLEAEPPPPGCNATAPCLSNLDCNDGNPCNGAETCVNNGCIPGTPFVCDDGDPCNGVETCDSTTGACTPSVPCDDGNPCNGTEVCDAVNGCQQGTPITCSDGDACNGLETCNTVDGSCQPAAPLVCDDANPCTTDSCDQSLGCLYTPIAGPCDDGSACTTGDACQGGACVGNPTVTCDDGDACNGVESCDPATGSCVLGTPPVCNDGNPCTDDLCDQTFGCLAVNNNNLCDDGSACTSGDACVNGVCSGAPIVCEDDDVCNGVATCDPVAGCQPGTPLDCDDGNPCTDDICDASLGCLHSNNLGPCDDGTACTAGDTCVAGTCAGVATVCDDGNLCNGVETCNPVDGSCQAGTPLPCDDGNPCTDDMCDPSFGCLVANNSASCDDGNACTTGDSCAGGVCAGLPTICDDGNLCNGMEICNPFSGACEIALTLDCDDGDPCTLDVCDPLLGCTHAPDPLCVVGGLTSDVLSVQPQIVGGKGRKTLLVRRLAKIRLLLERAARNPRRARRSYSRAYNLLVQIQTSVRSGVQRHNFDLELADRVLSVTDVLMSKIRPQLNGP